MGERRGVFVEPEDGFADDDDLMVAASERLSLETEAAVSGGGRSFLERDNFENELGIKADDPFAEDFSDIIHNEIVHVLGDGDRVGRPIIVVYAFRLPSNKSFDHQKFLRFLQHTLDQVVDLDYTIVYCHYGLRSHNKPPLKWLMQAYRVLDRRYKKNLKALYLVHPTAFIRLVWGLFRPFISMKFERKMHYVNYLHELNDELRIESLNLPQPILEHDAHLSLSKGLSPSKHAAPALLRPTQQFGAPLTFILSHNPDHVVPPIVTELIAFMREHSLHQEGLFRKSAEFARIKTLQERVNRGEKIDFLTEPEYRDDVQRASIDASVLLKTFLRSMGEPVITDALYPRLIAISELPKEQKSQAITQFVRALPRENYLLLKTVCHFLTEVAENCKSNLMTPNNLSVVFGPNFTWPSNQQVPLTQLNHLNHFCYRLIVDYERIFSDR